MSRNDLPIHQKETWDQPFYIQDCWDDLRVPLSSVAVVGTAPPTLSQFQDDGTESIDYALEFDGSTDEHCTIPSHADLNFHQSDFSIALWFKPDASVGAGKKLIYKKNAWNIEVVSGNLLKVNFKGQSSATTTCSFLPGGRNCFVLSVNDNGADTEIAAWLNDVKCVEQINNGKRVTDTTAIVYVASNDGPADLYKGVIDEVRFWNTNLSDSEASLFFNTAMGTQDDVKPANLVAGYHLNENMGATSDNFEGDATKDMTLVNTPSWVTGLITGTVPRRGVYCYSFAPSIDQEVFFNVHLPHGYKYGSDLQPHLHWSPNDNNAGVVKWGLEYSLANINDVFPNTTTIEATESIDGELQKHIITDLGEVDGSQIDTISSMLLCRLFRNGSSAEDTYLGSAALFEFNFHYLADTIGSIHEIRKS